MPTALLLAEMNLVDDALLHVHEQNPITIKRDAVLKQLAPGRGCAD